MTLLAKAPAAVLIGFTVLLFPFNGGQARGPNGSADLMDTLDFSFIRDLGYKATNLGEVVIEGQPCWRIQLSDPTRTDTVMTTMVLLVRKYDSLPIRMDFYDRPGFVSKSLTLSAVDMKNGSPSAMRMTVKDHVNNTEMNLNLSVSYKWGSLPTVP